MYLKTLTQIILLSICSVLKAQEDQATKLTPFIAYEFGEAMFNNFRSLSGEVGIELSNKRVVRVVHQNVKLSEKHLSSDFAKAVNGDHVKGSLYGFEMFYGFPIINGKKENSTLYLSPSIGFYRNRYEHTLLSEEFEKRSGTVGLELSFREKDLFGLNGLYYTVSIPVRLHLAPHEEVSLGNSTITGGRFDNNIWLFVGYRF